MTDELAPHVRHLLETCRCYEYYYDAYFGPDAPFGNQPPLAADLATSLQDLCRETITTVSSLRREIRYLRAYGNKYCTAMADAARERGDLDTPSPE